MQNDIKLSADKYVDTEILVVGSEGAGSTCAIEAYDQGASVIIVTKGRIGRSGATVTGDSDHDVDSHSLHQLFPWLKGTDPNDSKEQFFEDMVKGGKYLNNQKMVEAHVEDAPKALKKLFDWGLTCGSSIIKTSGHSYPRGVASCGTKYTPLFRKQVEKRCIPVIEDTMITDLLTNEGRVVGAVGLNMRSGEFMVFRAKIIVLATGGEMRIYPIITAPEELTGDGIAMAYRAGADLTDMEFPMFLPGTFTTPQALLGVDVPFLYSTAGMVFAWMLNNVGERFMTRWAPETLEHSTRDICSVAMYKEVLKGRGSPTGGIYVSLKHLPNNLIDQIHKHALIGSKYGGFDMEEWFPSEELKTKAMEAVPGRHFFNGGIRINEHCETSLPGLFACGETTAGVHGGNRLSGNAFSEMVTWGFRAGRFAAAAVKNTPPPQIVDGSIDWFRKRVFQSLTRPEGGSAIELRKQIQRIAWEHVGIIRTEKLLKEAIMEITHLKRIITTLSCSSKDRIYNREWMEALQIENMLLCLEITARAALIRTESRAAHFREDYPQTDYKHWTKNIIVKKREGKMTFRIEPVEITTLPPPDKIVDYGVVD
jgi:succinate dehydrogenase/fumarate reductase flavoprotein subunit